MTATLSPPMFLYFPNPNNSGSPANGFKLFTYQAGTSIKQTTWTDSTQVSQNANPLLLDANGVASASSSSGIWGDPTLLYKFVWAPANDTDPPSSPIRTVDNIQFPVSVGLLTQAFIGGVLYPRTLGEISAGVTPVNYAYPPMYVDRYGTNTSPGTTVMTTAVQAAFNVAKKALSSSTTPPVIVFGAGPYLLDASIDATFNVTGLQVGFIVKGAAGYDNGANHTIVAKHTGYVFDLTGNQGVRFQDISIGTDATTFPKVCFFLARNAAGSSQAHYFDHVSVNGKFSNCIVYNCGSEDEQYENCIFFNTATTAGTKVIKWTVSNVDSLTSTFATVGPGVSCIDHKVVGGQFSNASGDAAADTFYIEGCRNVRLRDCWVNCGSGAVGGGGRSYVYIDQSTNISMAGLWISGMEGENLGSGTTQNAYGVLVSNNTGDITIGTSIRDCYLPNGTAAIGALGTNPTIDGWTIENIVSNNSGPISFPGTVEFSTINVQNANPLTIGTSINNYLVGQVSTWTITTRTRDSWNDTGVEPSWNPNFSALTVTGSPTITGRVIYHGRMVTVIINISGQTTLSATAGQQITGLPANATPALACADVEVFDTTANVSLGTGLANGTGLSMPAFTAGTHAVNITATYPAS